MKLGANIDTTNDEGFNALNYVLTKYLADKYNVTNWARGFMPPNRQNEGLFFIRLFFFEIILFPLHLF